MMFHSKNRSSLRFKSSSMLSLSEIENRSKSEDWKKKYQVRPKEIGRGHFSKVYYVSCENGSRVFAAKVIRRCKGGIDRLEKIKQEAALIRKLNEMGVQSVIQLYETYENVLDVILISELAKGGSLFKLVHEADLNLRPDYVKVIIYKLLFALEAMHKENIVHLDIKADNILLREPYPSTNIALCDFGLATQLKKGISHKELIGTPDYMAPEVINYENVSVNADMWSVGVVVYYLLTGISPFMGKSKDETLINVSKVNISFSEIFQESEYIQAKDFILSLCVKSPELRMSSTTSQKHCWFTNIEEGNLDLPFEDMDPITETNISDYSENEDDNNKLSVNQRWQSVNFDTLDMSSTTNQYKSLQMRSFSTASCENLFSDSTDFGSLNGTLTTSKMTPKKLMNVEEVNDESIVELGTHFGCSIVHRDKTENDTFIRNDENFALNNVIDNQDFEQEIRYYDPGKNQYNSYLDQEKKHILSHPSDNTDKLYSNQEKEHIISHFDNNNNDKSCLDQEKEYIISHPDDNNNDKLYFDQEKEHILSHTDNNDKSYLDQGKCLIGFPDYNPGNSNLDQENVYIERNISQIKDIPDPSKCPETSLCDKVNILSLYGGGLFEENTYDQQCKDVLEDISDEHIDTSNTFTEDNISCIDEISHSTHNGKTVVVGNLYYTKESMDFDPSELENDSDDPNRPWSIFDLCTLC